MPIFNYLFIVLSFIFILTGCSIKEINQDNIIIKDKVIKEKKIKKVKKVKELNVVKKIKKIKKIKKVKKSPTLYKYCAKHIKTMNHASSYIKDEFEKGYFISKDIVGAKAQLFLVKSNSTTIFAKNINDAKKSYLENYKIAKKYKCNLSKFKVPVLEKVQKRIDILEKEIKREIK